MSNFVARVKRDLDHIADRATPSPTAWEQIQTRIAEQADQPEMEIIMLQNKSAPPTWRRPLMLGSAAALVAIIFGVVLVSTRSNSESNLIAVTDNSVPVTDEVAPEATDAPATQPPTTQPPATTGAPTSSSLNPAEAAWEEIPIMLFSGVTGDFRTNTFGVPFKFDTGDMPHSKDWEREDWIAIRNDEVPGWIDVFLGLDSIDATIEEFQDMHDAYESAEMGEPEPATLDGAEGVVFQSVGLPAGVAVTEQDLYEFKAPITERGWTASSAYGIATPGTSSPGSAGVSIWVVDVNGQTVVVAQSALDMQVTADVHARSRQATQSLIDSIEWKNISSL